MNGTNVAAILNTTDTALQAALSHLRPNSTASPVRDGDAGKVKADQESERQSVDDYCATVHVNDFFWAQTCGRTPPTSGAVRMWARRWDVWMAMGIVVVGIVSG